MSAELDKEWEEYKIKFNKEYKDQEEEQKRRNLYMENKVRIEEHNKRFAAGEVTYSMGVNAFADKAPGETPCGGRFTPKK